MADEVLKDFGIGIKADTQEFDEQVDAAKKKAEKTPAKIPVSVDEKTLEKLNTAIHAIRASVSDLQRMQKGLIRNVNTGDNKKLSVMRVEIVGINKALKSAVEAIQEMNASFKDDGAVVNSLKSLESTLKSIESYVNNISKANDWGKLRPTESIRQDIEETQSKLQALQSSTQDYEKTLASLRRYGNRGFVGDIMTANSADDIDASDRQIKNWINSLSNLIDLGGSLSDITFYPYADKNQTATMDEAIRKASELNLITEETVKNLSARSGTLGRNQLIEQLTNQLQDYNEEYSKAQQRDDLGINAKVSFNDDSLKDFTNALTASMESLSGVFTSALENVQLNVKNVAPDTQSAGSEKSLLDESNAAETLLSNITRLSEEIPKKTQAFKDEGDAVTPILNEEAQSAGKLADNIDRIQKSISSIDPDKLNTVISSEAKLPDSVTNSPQQSAKELSQIDRRNAKYEELSNTIQGIIAAYKNLRIAEKTGNSDSLQQLQSVYDALLKQKALIEEEIQSSGLSNSRKDSAANREYTKGISNAETQASKEAAKIISEQAINKEKVAQAASKAAAAEEKAATAAIKRADAEQRASAAQSAGSARDSAIARANNALDLLSSSEGKVSKYAQAFSQARIEIDGLIEALPDDADSATLSKFTSQVNTILELLSNKNWNATGKEIGIFADPKDLDDVRSKMMDIVNSTKGAEIAGKGFNEATGKLTYTVQNADKTISTYELSVNSLTGAISRVNKGTVQAKSVFEQIGDTLDSGAKKVVAYVASFGSFYELWDQLRQGYTIVSDLDKAQTEMRKVSEESTEALKAYGAESFNIAQQTGSTAKVIQNSTADWMRLGESLKDAKESAKDTSILMNVSEFEDIGDATDSLVAMSQAYRELDKMDIIDKLNLTGNNFSISTSDLAESLQRSAAALKVAGNDINEAIALTVSGNSILQSPDEVASALRTISMRITGTSAKELEAMGEDTEGLIETTSKLQDTVKSLTAVNGKMGVSITNANGSYKSTYEILQEIADVWKEIQAADALDGKNRANALLETLAGDFCLKNIEIYFQRTHLTALIA